MIRHFPIEDGGPKGAGPSSLGEFPEFSDEEKNEIRRVLGEAWQRDHREKNSTSNRHEGAALTERMRRYEDLMAKVAQL